MRITQIKIFSLYKYGPLLFTSFEIPSNREDPHLRTRYGCMRLRSLLFVTVKDTAIPLQARTVPEGSRRLTFPDFKTVGIRRL